MNRDQSEFRAGLAKLLPDLRAFGRFLTRDAVAADDLVQEALLRALRAESQWQAGTSLRAWSFSILRNAFYEGRRRGAVERRVLDAVQPPVSEAARQHDRMEVASLDAALSVLPAHQREALVLVGALGFSYEEGAKVAGVAVGTLKARVSRARRALVEHFPSEAGGAPASTEGENADL
ncbi:sigma-70 family RNA polymerase sigma factor [Roseomonas sp. BN140053]|uniref:sigma-70 family RNA polymerase sigma factor n=1 Tax=Roseomonas sp. BN140053 TaxID=3391898 RepID=UPI0039ED9738